MPPDRFPDRHRAGSRLGRLQVLLVGSRVEEGSRVWLVPAGTFVLTAAMVLVVGHSLDLYVSLPIAFLGAAVMGGMSAAYLANDEAEAEDDGDGRRPPGGGEALPEPPLPRGGPAQASPAAGGPDAPVQDTPAPTSTAERERELVAR